MEQQALSLIGNRYQLEELLGRGGMGEVYRAYDRLDQKQVALKRVLFMENAPEQPEAEGDKTPVMGLLGLAQEFRILASLRHPNIISVLDYGFDRDRLPY